MAEASSLFPAWDRDRQRQVLAVVLVVLGIAGHVAWAVSVDASRGPYLAERDAEARASVAEVFPNATPPTVHVVVAAGPDGSVLSPEGLTALATLRNGITSDEALLPVLARDQPVISILETLEPALEGSPGEWDQATVDSALENVTRTSQGQRSLALFLDQGATLHGAQSRANATILEVRLSGTAPPAAVEAAETRIQAIAEAAGGSGVTMATDAGAVREAAARSPVGWWVPAVALFLLVAGWIAVDRRWRQLGRGLVLWVGGAGSALLVGLLVGQATPVSLAVAHVTAGIGLAGTLAFGARPPPVALAAVLPPAALIGWAPAGTGGLAAVASAGLALPLAAGHLWPGHTRQEGPASGPWSWEAGHLWRMAAAALLVTVCLGALAFAGLASQAEPGWTGNLPTSTEAGQAEALLSGSFRGPGPASEFVVTAWGPVAEPGFLFGLAEASEQLERLSLAATDEQVHSVLSLARDWATDDTDQDPTDDYDPGFAERWEQATRGGQVPVQDVPIVLEALARLDPEGTRSVLTLETGDGPRPTGAALLRQRVSLAEVVPRPGQALSAAIQPLLASSEEVVVSGPVLAEERTRTALLDGQGPVVLVTLAATVLALAVHVASRPIPREALGALAAVTLGSVVVCLGGITLMGLAVRPLILLAPALTASLAILLGAPLSRRIGQALGEETPYPEAVATACRRMPGWTPLVPVAAVAVAVVSVPAPGLRGDGLGLAVGLAAASLGAMLVLPSLAKRWVPEMLGQTGSGAGPRPARLACPVCSRSTATAAARCRACGTWSLVQACPAHPDAISSSCASCGAELTEPSFG